MSPTPKTLNVTECHQLLNALLVKDAPHKTFRKGIRNYTIALLMLEAGLRVGEVVQLTDRDLYFNSRPVTSIIISPEIAKNKRERTIPVSERLSNALKEFYPYTDTTFVKPTAAYVFFQADQRKPLTTRQVERIIRAAAIKSLGRPIHPHVLRHTFASKLMRVTDMRTVQELLGHKNLSSTQIYTHPNQDDLKKAINQIDNSATGPAQADQASV